VAEADGPWRQCNWSSAGSRKHVSALRSDLGLRLIWRTKPRHLGNCVFVADMEGACAGWVISAEMRILEAAERGPGGEHPISMLGALTGHGVRTCHPLKPAAGRRPLLHNNWVCSFLEQSAGDPH